MCIYFHLARQVGDRSGSDRFQGCPGDFNGHIGWYLQQWDRGPR
jgi:hypothetical protein